MPLVSKTPTTEDPAVQSLLGRVGRRVRALRSARGLTAKETAGRAGLSPLFYSDLEGGKANIAIGRLAAVSTALDVPLEELVSDRPEAGDLTSWYTLTPDAQPLVGPVESIEGLFVATGFSGHGFKLAPVIGQGMAQILHGERITLFDGDLFDPQRFPTDGSCAATFDGRFGF